MAIRASATEQLLTRTTSLPSLNSTYSIAFWIYIVNRPTVTQANVSIMAILGSASFAQRDTVAIDNNGVLNAGTELLTTFAGSTLSNTTWYHICMVRESGTSLKVYLNGVLDITNTDNVGTGRGASVVIDLMDIVGVTDRFLDGRMFACKIWDAALTLAEVQNEVRTIRPMRYTNINGWYPFFNAEHLQDYSGLGRNWTEVGTLTDEAPAPIGYGQGVKVIQRPVKVETLSPTGSITPTGSLIKRANVFMTGALSSIVGAMLKVPTKLLAGVITDSGQLVNQAAIDMGGTIPPAGIDTFQVNKLVAGNLASSGSDTFQVNKLFSGVLTLSGVLASTLSKIFTGTLTLAGSVTYQVNKLFTGAITLSGNLTKQANIFFVGTLTLGGVVFKQANVFFTSAITSIVGALTTTFLAVRQFGGSLSSSSDITKLVTTSKAGSVSPAGSDVLQVNKIVSSTLPASGVTQDQINKAISGAISSSGSDRYQANKVFAGSIGSSSVLITTTIPGGLVILVITGTITPTGELITTVMPLLCLTDWTIEELTEFSDSDYQDEPRPALVPSGFMDTPEVKNSDWTI